MAKSDKYSVKDLKKQFPNDAVCLEYLFDNLHSRKCSCGGEYAPMFRWDKAEGKLVGRKQFQCGKCRFQIAPMAGTIFEKSSSELTLWFHALFVFSNAKSGLSAKELERQLGVTYKTAWRMLTLIRKSLKQPSDYLSGDVEMDETFFGGKGDAGRNNEKLSSVMKKKSVIIGAVKRKGELKAKVSPNTKAKTLANFLDNHVYPMDTRLLTDESNRYINSTWGYTRLMVNHKRKEYVRGDVHTNQIEGFWGHIKRSINGTHKVISKKYLQAYLDGFVWHYNNRHNDKQRFASLLGALLHA